MYNENRGLSTNEDPCSYWRLSSYKKEAPKYPNLSDTVGYYMVPDWDHRPKYNTLSKGTCTGYSNIMSAYGENAKKCGTKFHKKIVTGCGN